MHYFGAWEVIHKVSTSYPQFHIVKKNDCAAAYRDTTETQQRHNRDTTETQQRQAKAVYLVLYK